MGFLNYFFLFYIPITDPLFSLLLNPPPSPPLSSPQSLLRENKASHEKPTKSSTQFWGNIKVLLTVSRLRKESLQRERAPKSQYSRDF